MVILLALYPLAAAAGLAVLDRLVPLGIVGWVTSSPAIAAMLCSVVLASVILAAVRQRDSTVLLSAWLFFFCGEMILSLGYVLESFVPPGAHWIEEVFELVSFFPLLVFVAYVASPVRLLILPRARARRYPLVGALLLAGAVAVAFVPWALGMQGARRFSPAENFLHLSQTALDMVMLEPIALVLLVIGINRSSRPYAFLGIGLTLFLPEDILGGYGILHAGGLFGRYAHLVFIVSQLYIINGALLAAFQRKRVAETGQEPRQEPEPDSAG